MRARFFLLALSVVLFAPSAAWAIEQAPRRLTLKEAVAHALDKNPAAVTASTKEAAAQARVEVAKSLSAPRMSVVGQINRSTGNVVPGATFALAGLPGVQGPPGATRFGAGVWQSVAGLTASWDVLELLRRPVVVGAADAEVTASRTQSEATRLAIAAHAVDAYLLAVEADALVKAAEASEKRNRTLVDVVTSLTNQKLRPELDLARAQTELASARVLVQKTRLGVAVTSGKLAEAIGESDWTVEVAASDFEALPPMPASATTNHPAVAAHDDAARAAEARASVARLGLLPRVELAGAAWLRGGGYVLGGPNSGDLGGLLPDTPNWALGVVATWTPTDRWLVAARARAESAEALVHKARASEAREALTTEAKVARATLTSALAVVKETNGVVAVARRAVELANTRYTTGNGPILEVADAERALAAAERDDALARLDVWRAVAAVYRAQGDLQPLVGVATRAKG